MLMNWLLGITNALAEGAEGAVEGAVEGAEGAVEGMQGASAAASLISMLLSLVFMVAIFYFLLIRPQRKKDKKVKEMLNSLKQGDRVTTIGGIFGTITNIKDDTITLAVGAQRTEMVFARWAIRSVEAVSVENDGEVLA